MGRTQTEDVLEQGAVKNISTYKGESNTMLEEIA
jgi:hypothetical protein